MLSYCSKSVAFPSARGRVAEKAAKAGGGWAGRSGGAWEATITSVGKGELSRP